MNRVEGLAGLAGRYDVVDPAGVENLWARLRGLELDSNVPMVPPWDWVKDISSFNLEEIGGLVGERGEAASLVTVTWASEAFAVRMQFSDLVKRLDDLWFPSSDDLFIVDERRGLVLLLDHEERLAGVQVGRDLVSV